MQLIEEAVQGTYDEIADRITNLKASKEKLIVQLEDTDQLIHDNEKELVKLDRIRAILAGVEHFTTEIPNQDLRTRKLLGESLKGKY